MANDELVKLQVSDELIRGIVTKQVSAAMLTAMGGREEFLQKIVESVMTWRCGPDGNRSDYPTDNKYQWLDVQVRKMIQAAATEGIKALIQNNQPAIEKAISSGLKNQTKQMATAFSLGLLKSVESSFQFKVDVSFKS